MVLLDFLETLDRLKATTEFVELMPRDPGGRQLTLGTPLLLPE